MASPPASVVIVTGLSGAGKSTALKALEDAGHYCIDNLPLPLLPALATGLESGTVAARRLALVFDARTDHFAPDLQAALAPLRDRGVLPEILFLDADDDAILRRYSEMRRRHPLAADSVREAIGAERRMLAPLKATAAVVIDTTRLNPHQLRGEILQRFRGDGPREELKITLLSFGFKHGLPLEADMVFDARFLPNPYFVASLKDRTGKEAEVADYALANETGQAFLDHLEALFGFLVPKYRAEGKAYLTIAIGCTGGRHRSVATAEALGSRLNRNGRVASVHHRDLGR